MFLPDPANGAIGVVLISSKPKLASHCEDIKNLDGPALVDNIGQRVVQNLTSPGTYTK